MIDNITYPEIRALKARFALTDVDLGIVIGNNYQTVSKKLRMIYDFSHSDMLKLKKFFDEKGEKISFDKLFFDFIL